MHIIFQSISHVGVGQHGGVPGIIIKTISLSGLNGVVHIIGQILLQTKWREYIGSVFLIW